MQDPGVDGLLVILTPQAMTDPTAVAQALRELVERHRKPLLGCWMGQIQVDDGRRVLGQANIPTFHTPEAAVEAFSYLVNHYRNQHLLLQTPGPLSVGRAPDVEGARLIIESALSEGRKVLSESESKAVLNAFRIPTGQASVVRSPTEALVQAKKSIGIATQVDRLNGYQFELEAYNQLVGTEDREEGIQSFLENRPARFRGR